MEKLNIVKYEGKFIITNNGNFSGMHKTYKKAKRYISSIKRLEKGLKSMLTRTPRKLKRKRYIKYFGKKYD